MKLFHIQAGADLYGPAPSLAYGIHLVFVCRQEKLENLQTDTQAKNKQSNGSNTEATQILCGYSGSGPITEETVL